MDAAPHPYQPIIAGPAAAALAALTPAQISFIRALPKAELHAHLNGSIPFATLRELARAHPTLSTDPAVQAGLAKLEGGVQLAELHDFFGLFPAIYALTSTPAALQAATRAVLASFLTPGLDGAAECAYLELRTGPRATEYMSRREYLEAVLDAVEAYPPEQAALIVALDRPMPDEHMSEVVALAVALKAEGRRVMGIDLCGSPVGGDVAKLCARIREAKAAGLKVTLHVAEVTEQPDAETTAFLDTAPDRLGHATFLNEAARRRVIDGRIPVELCLSSNLLCKTVPTLADHHLRWYLEGGHPVAICTDDVLPFRTSLTAEYALLLAPPPAGLGLAEDQLRRIAEGGMRARFGSP